MTNDLEIGSILEIEPIYEMAKHDSIVPVLGFRASEKGPSGDSESAILQGN